MHSKILVTLLLAPFRPRRVAELHARTPLLHALGHQLLLITVAFAAFVALWMMRFVLDWNEFYSVSDQRITPRIPSPDELLGIAVGILAGGLLTSLVTAVGLLPWVWRAERARDTCKHALRIGCVMLGAWGWPWLIADIVQGVLGRSEGGFSDDHLYWVEVAVSLAWPAWSVWALFRAATAPRPATAVDDGPLCEACGYLLKFREDAERCSECGEPVNDSLGIDHRRPPGSADAPGLDLVALALDGWAALAKPERFFRVLALNDSPRAAFRFLVVNMLLTALLLGYLIVSLDFYFNRGHYTGHYTGYDYLMAWQVAGVMVWLVFGAWSCAIGLIGLMASWRSGRNLLGAIGRIGAYTAGWFPLWVVASGIALGVLEVLTTVYRNNDWVQMFAVLCFGGLNLLFVIGYLGMVIRRIKHVRYANWQ